MVRYHSWRVGISTPIEEASISWVNATKLDERKAGRIGRPVSSRRTCNVVLGRKGAHCRFVTHSSREQGDVQISSSFEATSHDMSLQLSAHSDVNRRIIAGRTPAMNAISCQLNGVSWVFDGDPQILQPLRLAALSVALSC
jgi:hypothetical protein